ncbi:SLC13 family permease [Streptomyces sp. NBC_01465]|uniref:SLC13 family permease n=1 Tax=Streptomyces sp. NBC_01465 TaxID=2903878 RepID=UPI002E367126|nr:SLC13 family permease [Streptomyces sp. NBC_01465]
MSDAALCLTLLGVVVGLFVWNRLPVELVALGSAVVLYATGLLTADQVFAGFGDPVVVFVASLFVVSTALQATGLTAWAGRRLSAQVGTGPRSLTTATMLLAGALAALITVNGAVAALLPLVVMLGIRSGQTPSRLVMPLAFAGHAGSLLLLIGSPINLIVSEAADESGAGPFGFFQFALIGVPILAGTVAIALLLGPRLLPRREPEAIPPDLSRHAHTLVTYYGLERDAASLQLGPDSSLVGTPPPDVTALAPAGLLVVGALTADGHDSRGDAPLQPGDVLIVRGDLARVEDFARATGLVALPPPLRAHLADAVLNSDTGLVEVVVSPRSPLIGTTVFPGMNSADGELVIITARRSGRDTGPGPTVVQSGDSLLLQGPWQAVQRTQARRDLLAVDHPTEIRREATGLGPDAWRTAMILTAMVVLLATGLVPPPVSGLLAALAIVACRVVTVTEAYDGISWTTLVIVGGMFPLSVAIQESGAADDIAHVVVSAASGNAYLLLLAVFVLTSVLGQFISNMATALIVTPVAVSAAHDAGISVLPVLMCVAVAAAAALLTPVATAANMMVMGPGGYRFGDYWKFGAPILLWYLVVAMALVPLVWAFQPPV